MAGIAEQLILRVADPTGRPAAQAGSALPAVTDPEKTLSSLSREQYENYVKNFGSFENAMIDRAMGDTSLVDQARSDAPKASALAAEIAKRNMSRYGVSAGPAATAEMDRSFARTGALTQADAVNNARLEQDTLNSKLALDIINIGQGVQSGANANLASAAANKSALDNAYRDARTNVKNSRISNIAGLGSLAIMAAAI